MGLDMYLTGRKSYGGNWKPTRMEDGFPVESVEISLGYWRKHANLHGYIVQVLADGNDDCQDIEITIEQLNQLIDAVQSDAIHANKTEGFFFGSSYLPGEEGFEAQKREDLDILGRALGWMAMEFEPKPEWKYLVYRASW